MARIAVVLIGFLIASGAALTYGAYHRDITSARARVAVGSQVAQTRCGPIEYASTGAGPPVLIVHGAGGGYDQGLQFGSVLATGGYRAIAMSRFGYLRTPLPHDASAAAQADAHACLLDALGIGKAAIVGASAGALSSMQFALRHAQRCTALVLLVPAAYAPRAGGEPSVRTSEATGFLFDTALRSDFLLWAAVKLAPRTVTRALLATPPAVLETAAADEQARVAQVLADVQPVSLRRQGLLNDAAVISSVPRYELERIGAPTLIIGTEDDLFGTYDAARYAAAQIPHARFVGYASGGHLWVGHQKEVAAQILALLAQAGK